MLDDLDKRLNALRPFTRQEFRSIMEPVIAALDERLKKMAFDYERAPYIEKRGLHDARNIITSVPADAYPEPVLFLYTCLQRVESFLYERVRTPDAGGGADEQRTLMYRSGVFKTIKALAELLPDSAYEAWSFRRKALNIIEDRLWRMSPAAAGAQLKDREALVMLADTLLSLPPSEMRDFSGAGQFAEWFAGEGGEEARRLADQVKVGSRS